MQNDDDQTAGRLIRLTGRRPHVPPARQVRPGHAARAALQRANRRRTRRRRAAAVAGLLSAAALIVIAARLWTASEPAGSPDSRPPRLVTVELVDGPVAHAIGQTFTEGSTLETPANGRVALRLPDRTSLRLDTDTRIRLISAADMELTTGAIYVDSGTGSAGIQIRTPFGNVRDVGTQFEVRLAPPALRISVRSGRVLLERARAGRGASQPSDFVSVGPGTQLTVSVKGRKTEWISASGSLWSWTASLSPPFSTDGQPLAAFLNYLAREHGWVVRYENAELERDASSIILDGSIISLAPEQSLAVALRTSGLTYRIADGEVLISRSGDRR